MQIKNIEKKRICRQQMSLIVMFLSTVFKGKLISKCLFRGQGRNSLKNFVGFLVETMAPKRHFEIN